MGIKEHLEGHPDKGELNLSDLALEEREAEEEISDKEWRKFKQGLENCRKIHDWQNFSYQAMRIKILFPDRVDELNLDNQDFQTMKQALEVNRRGRGVVGIFFSSCVSQDPLS